jgi:hypothetical protein
MPYEDATSSLLSIPIAGLKTLYWPTPLRNHAAMCVHQLTCRLPGVGGTDFASNAWKCRGSPGTYFDVSRRHEGTGAPRSTGDNSE